MRTKLTLIAAITLLPWACTRKAKTEYGTWGFETASSDLTARPGDSFFRFAVGDWVDRTPMPADKSHIGVGTEMNDRVQARIRGLLESAASRAAHEPTDLDGKIGAFYKSFMDEARVEHLGEGPLHGNSPTSKLLSLTKRSQR